MGLTDVSTLGKIDIQGPDAATLLDRVYCNTFSTLAVGRARYGLMLREDGFVMDDGTTSRLGPEHFLMTTTTANAIGVMRHLEFCHQCLWPDLDVQMATVSEQWAQLAIAGPRSRDVLAACRRSPARHLERGVPVPDRARRHDPRRHTRAAVPHLLFRRAGVRARRAGRRRRAVSPRRS